MGVVQGGSNVQVRVLGPVLIGAGGGEIRVDRPLERAVLVRLALAGGVPVADGRLAVDLWGDGEVSRPVQRLRVIVSRLRTALGVHGASVLRTRAGYRTATSVGDLPAAESAAERMYAAHRSGRYAAARAAADEALRWWRGPALADLTWAPYAAAEAARLDRWRLEVATIGFDAALRQGCGPELVRELAILAGEHPWHEPLARMYALALYRAGSQVDALNRLRALRAGLAGHLGAAVSPETAELELRILRHDPSLNGFARRTRVAGSGERQRELAALVQRLGQHGLGGPLMGAALRGW
ncbi:hypothetical protein D5S18_27465 [Nocardia panacis]|uniref:Bacterial transcriptional activator domain-containing protein n=1 Tax=Nocardia panacis TaxID=2340916 RepID=A0A3A4KBR8_9NOCA|nr:BTAD domain-containing putative transcriptional regulator [Nocardia panacis]RJO70920.1 hypothetical protein D5S18_27465 [Nocardia panacis]